MYATSLAEFGRPRRLARSGAWILERKIPGNEAWDAMGCYPIFCCLDWGLLDSDLAEAGQDLVSLTVVPDVFGNYTTALLRSVFRDVVTPFKDHFVTNLRAGDESLVSKHHRYYAKRALARVEVEICAEPSEMLDQWLQVYDALRQRRHLQGIHAFSRGAFAMQLNTPGLVFFRATHGGQTIGAHLWYIQGNVAYSHLAASNSMGYQMMAAYALHISAITYFRQTNVNWLDWGGGAGLGVDDDNGLSRFKRGWANETRPAYICGRIFDREQYDKLSQKTGTMGAQYFPAYRVADLMPARRFDGEAVVG